MMLDAIQIEGLLVRCIIGVTADERRDRQDVVIDLTLWGDFRAAGASDDLAQAVNYRTVTKKVIRLAEESSCRLVEALAERVARLCLDDARIQRVRVRVAKPGALRFARNVAVEIVRPAETDPRA